MEININEQTDLSLNELIHLKEQGKSLVRSAHVGNHRMYNLVLADAGVDMLLVDHNKTAIDKNYLPEMMIRDGESKRLTEQEHTLSLRTELEQGIYLDELHCMSLQKAFNNTLIQTNTEYIRRHVSIAEEIIGICIAEMPEQFSRLALPDGTTKNSDPGSIKTFSTKDVLQLKDDPRAEEQAVMLSNETDIICGFVIEALNSNQDTQYHISGPDMVVYLKNKNKLATLQKMYRLMSKASFAHLLPETLSIQLVPGVAFGLASTMTNQHKINDLIAATTAFTEHESVYKEKKAQIFKDPSLSFDQRLILSSPVEREKSQILQNLVETAEQNGSIIDQQRPSSYTSQYDVISNPLYVPEIVKTTPVKHLMKIMKIIQENIP